MWWRHIFAWMEGQGGWGDDGWRVERWGFLCISGAEGDADGCVLNASLEEDKEGLYLYTSRDRCVVIQE